MQVKIEPTAPAKCRFYIRVETLRIETKFFLLPVEVKHKSLINLFHSYGNKGYICENSASKKSLKMKVHGRANLVPMSVTYIFLLHLLVLIISMQFA